MKHFPKPLWNRDSEALKSSWGLLPASKGSELCSPTGMKDGSNWLGHTSWERNRKDSDLSSLQSANPARSGSHLLILNQPLWEVRDFPTPLSSLLLQPCTFPVNNAIKKLSVDFWRRKGRDNTTMPSLISLQSHMKTYDFKSYPSGVPWVRLYQYLWRTPNSLPTGTPCQLSPGHQSCPIPLFLLP